VRDSSTFVGQCWIRSGEKHAGVYLNIGEACAFVTIVHPKVTQSVRIERVGFYVLSLQRWRWRKRLEVSKSATLGYLGASLGIQLVSDED